MGLSDPDRVRTELVASSVAARPLLRAGRAVLDVGSGVGLPGLALALADPARPVFLLEPRARNVALLRWLLGRLPPLNVTVLPRALQELSLPRLPPVQVVSRAAMDWETLDRQLPAGAQPRVRWVGPRVPSPPDRPGWRAVRLVARTGSTPQTLEWWGKQALFHVKHPRWRRLPGLQKPPSVGKPGEDR